MMVTMASLTPTVCTVSDLAIYDTTNGPRGTVRAKSNGTCSIKIDFPGDASQLSSTATWTSTVTGVNAPVVGSNTPQTITFPAIPNRDYGASYYLQATSSSKLPVKYRSLTPTACQIIEQLANGPAVQSSYPLTGAASMVCTIEATQAGDDRYAPAPAVQQSFTYSKAAMVIKATSAPVWVANGVNFSVTVSTLYVNSAMNSGLLSLGHDLVVKPLTPAVCSVTSSGKLDATGGIFYKANVKAVSPGSCQIQFDFAGTDARAATTFVYTGTVK